MKKHTLIYMNHFGYGEQDVILCENKDCGSNRAVDVHHIDRRGMGGSKEKDNIENLVGLCRNCHDLAEADPVFNEKIKHDHLRVLEIHAAIQN